MMDAKEIYNQTQANLRATDDISFKLIGLVPFATLLSFIGVFYRDIGGWKSNWLYLVGVIGALVVFGIYRWELRNIQRCYELCNIIDKLEKEVPELYEVEKYATPRLFNIRIGKTQAEKLIYSVLILSWLLLPLILRGEALTVSHVFSSQTGYLVFCTIMIFLLAVSGLTSIKKKALDAKKQTLKPNER